MQAITPLRAQFVPEQKSLPPQLSEENTIENARGLQFLSRTEIRKPQNKESEDQAGCKLKPSVIPEADRRVERQGKTGKKKQLGQGPLTSARIWRMHKTRGPQH